jgi:hypothetical protein
MKNSIIAIGSFCSLVLMLFLASCGSSSTGPTAKEVSTQKLVANTWRVNTVTVDAVDQTALFTGMTLKFTATGYTTTNGGVVWPASGTWSFTDEAGKIIKRSDNQEVTITEISDTILKLSLTRTQGTLGSGRTESIAGNHVFNLVKQ